MTKDLADELERLALQERFSIVDVGVFVQDNLPAILSALRGEEWRGIETAPEGVAVLIGGDWPDGDPWWTVGERMGNFWTTAANADPTRWRPLPPPPKGTTHE